MNVRRACRGLSAVLRAPTFVLCTALCVGAVHATEAVVADYMLDCQGCHLPDGRGHPEHGVPALTGSVGNFLRVEGGREFLLRVPGVAQSALSDERLAAVLNWMLKTFSPRETPADAKPFTAAEVARQRRQPLVDIKTTRQQLVQRIERLRSAQSPAAASRPGANS